MRPPLERQEAERLVETYSDLVLRLSYSYLNQTQDAQDICQTVFLKLLERAPDSSPRTTKSLDHPHHRQHLQGPAEKPLAPDHRGHGGRQPHSRPGAGGGKPVGRSEPAAPQSTGP